MPTFTMPQLGESDVEGTVLRWLKQPGEHVRAEEPLVEVETEKVNVEIPSPFEGTLTQILVQEGETVPVGTELAVIGEADLSPRPPALAGTTEPSADGDARTGSPPGGGQEVGEGAAAPARANGSAPAPAPAAQGGPAPSAQAEAGVRESEVAAEPTTETLAATAAHVGEDSHRTGSPAPSAPAPGRYTPAVLRLAAEHGVDLKAVPGTGLAGRVTRKDVVRFVEQGGARAAVAAPQPPVQAPPIEAATPATATPPVTPVTAASPPAPARDRQAEPDAADHRPQHGTRGADHPGGLDGSRDGRDPAGEAA
jgi:2-oxoglutarate dehydrogenase E2 component (dihydrolipoamide succinyltransferase)